MINNRLGPCDPTVSVLIDRSYPVVREVYLHLKEILAVYGGLDAIDFVSQHMEEIKKLQDAANKIIRVWESIDNIDALSAKLPELTLIHGHLSEIVELAYNLQEILDAATKAQEAQQKAEEAAQNASNVQVEVERIKAEIDLIASTLNGLTTEVRQIAEQIKQSVSQAIKYKDQAKEYSDSASGFANDAHNALEEALKASQKAEQFANEAGFSYRYSKNLIANDRRDINFLVPSFRVKVGDHVVNKEGQIFRINSLEDNSFTVGEVLTSLMGPKGDQGIQGERGVQGERGLRGHQGIPGDKGEPGRSFDPTHIGLEAEKKNYDGAGKNTSFLATDTGLLYFKQSNSLGDWSKGIPFGKGEQGLSANEILMKPDPVDFFDQIYGESHGDIIGSLVISTPPVKPDPTGTFENNLN